MPISSIPNGWNKSSEMKIEKYKIEKKFIDLYLLTK